MQQPEPLGNAETHWSRMLHYDLFSAKGDDQEMSVATERSNDDGSPGRRGSPVSTAATRLAVFIAIYTVVAFAVHFMFWPDAAAIVPEAFPAAASAARWSDDVDEDSVRVDISRHSKADAAAESSMYD
jgi:hypothetical protein